MGERRGERPQEKALRLRDMGRRVGSAVVCCRSVGPPSPHHPMHALSLVRKCSEEEKEEESFLVRRRSLVGLSACGERSH